MIEGTGFTPSLSGVRRGFEMLNRSAERLATGSRINRASDDPAGLITSENLRAVLAALDAESRSLSRASQVATVADGALSEVSSLLTEAQGLAVAAANTAGTSDAEREAMQMEMNSIISTVDRLTGGATFNGSALFDGTTTITAGDASVALDALSSGTIGATEIDGTSYTLASLQSGGSASLVGGGAEAAMAVLESAAAQINTARGEVGAFDRYAVQGRVSAIAVEMENVAAAQSQIRDADAAAEVSSMIRADVQVRASLMSASVQQELATRVIDLLG